MAKLPFIKFYPLDWLRDTLKLTHEVKAAWIDILALAWNEPERGVYRRTLRAMAQEMRITSDALPALLEDLKCVADVTVEGDAVTVMSRRMIKEESMREYDRNKKRWQREKRMSPLCPPIVPQEKLEVRSQKLEVTNVKDNTQRRRSAPSHPFLKPSLEDLTAYAKEKGFALDGQRFWDHYEANGWKVGRVPMRDWRATVRNWMRSDYRTEAKNAPHDSAGVSEYAALARANREAAELRKKESINGKVPARL